MKTETITRVKLIASEGMILTDGTTYGTVVFLSEGQTGDNFTEITKEEYERILEEQSEVEPV